MATKWVAAERTSRSESGGTEDRKITRGASQSRYRGVGDLKYTFGKSQSNLKEIEELVN